VVVLVFALTLVAPQTAFAKSQLPQVFFVARSPAGSGHTGGSCSSPSFNTIQSAVSAVPAGSVILVCPGIYKEQVTISKSLSLIGSGPSQTTILAPSSLSADSFGLQNIVDISGPATKVTLSGFTISGPGPAGVVCSIVFGVFVSGGATANIVGNSIAHVKDNPISNCNTVGFGDAGIGVGWINPSTGASLTTGHATISLNSLYDDQGNGINILGAGSTATIIGNTLIGIGSEALSYQNGMEVDTFPPYSANPAVATVSWNTVNGYECPVGTNVGGGILCGGDLETAEQDLGIIVFGPSTGTLVSNNNVYGNDAGIGGSSVGEALASGVTYSQNNVHDNRYSNLWFYGATNNQIIRNIVYVSNPTASGAPCQLGDTCYPYSYTLGIDMMGGSANNLISNNKVTVTADSYAILLDSLSSGNVVAYNTLSANHGATIGNAAVEDLGADTVSNNN
jgi:Right handed beta helix region